MPARDDFLFQEVARWDVPPGATGAEQMALDEVMLRLADRPTMRIYRWLRPEVTCGYPQRWAEAEAFAAGRPVTRRCTGGGLVEHGDDVTVALAVPAPHPFSRLAAGEAYRRIHAAMAGREGGLRLATEEDERRGAACFASPARHDVMDGSRKVLGGAQRRTRDGFLYQGSWRGTGEAAAGFAAAVADWAPRGWEALRDELVRERYGAAAWNRRR